MPKSPAAALNFALAWAFLAIALATPILLYEFRDMRNWSRIANDPATANGEIAAKTCSPASGFRSYTFKVDGKPFENAGSVKGGSACAALRVGAPLRVHYERSNPANNTEFDPSAALWNDVTSILLMALIFPPLLLSRWRSWRAQGGFWSWTFTAKPSTPPESPARAGRSSAHPPAA